MNNDLGLGTYRNTAIYRAMGHPDGSSVLPEYVIRGNEIVPYHGGPAHYEIKGNSVYSTMFAPEGSSISPIFTISGNEICPTIFHDKGSSIFAWFEIR